MPNNHETIIFIMAFQELPRNFSRIVKIIHSACYSITTIGKIKNPKKMQFREFVHVQSTKKILYHIHTKNGNILNL